MLDSCPDSELWTYALPAARLYDLHLINGVDKPGLGKTDRRIHTGNNSGYQLINLVYHFGATRIYLLGYDMKNGPKGERHWHGDHPRALSQASNYPSWVKRYRQLAQDLDEVNVPVINLTRDTALDCFVRGDIEGIL